MLFSFLRFLTIFSILLLLVNPKFEQLKVYVEKPNLVVAVDNSNSVEHLNQDEKAKEVFETITKNQLLNEKFNVDVYTFGEIFKVSDSITFSEKQTNIDETFNKLTQIYKRTTTPTILITDGNQTFGNDYEFIASAYKQPVYPVILGDTTTYADLKIKQLNVNRYAYLKNSFPIETILVYNGNTNVNSKFVVTRGNTNGILTIYKFYKK